MAEVLIIGGGGGGGYGGGGAGGLLYYGSEAPKTPNGVGLSLLAGTIYTITVGAGGLKGATDGGNSSLVGGLHNLIAPGGGRGANGQNPIGGTGNAGANAGNGSAGGSGGGGGHNGSPSTLFSSGGAGASGQGNAGGGGGWYGSYNGAGGGGGAGGTGASGGPVVSLNAGGKGGDGLPYAITGTTIYYAPGGGGAYGGAPGLGGSGVSGTDSNALATEPKANVGQGGNGANCYSSTRASGGGSGVVIIRTTASGAVVTGSPTVIQTGAYFVYVFTGSGTFKPLQNEDAFFTPIEVDRSLWLVAAWSVANNTTTGAVTELVDASGWGRTLASPSIATSTPIKSADSLHLDFGGAARLERYQKGTGRGVSALSMFALVRSTSEATQLVQAVTARFADIMAGIMINESSNPGQISAVARRSPTDTLEVTPLGEFVQGEQTLVYAFWDFAGGTCGGAMNAAGPISVGLSGSSGPTLDSLRGFCLGGTQRGEYPLVGSWAGAVVLERIPSLSERQRLEGYLAWLINDSALLPEGHPYRVSPPESIGPAVVAVVPAIAPPQVSMAGSLIVDASGITAPTYRHRLAGTVTILDKPVRRRVVVTHRITEELIAVTESDPVTGAWEVTHLPQYPEKMLLVTAFDDMGQYNAVPADFITQVEG